MCARCNVGGAGDSVESKVCVSVRVRAVRARAQPVRPRGLCVTHRRCVCSSVHLLRTLQHPQVSQWHNGAGLHSGLAAPVPQSSPKIRHSEFTSRTNIHKNLLLQVYAVKRRRN